MAEIRPFRGFRPPGPLAARVAGPPYDVVSTREARALAGSNRDSILHVTKPEIGLPDSVGAHDPEVYGTGRANLDRLLRESVLVRDAVPCLYVCRQTLGEHVQTGLMGAASVAEYDSGRIRRHELTRPDKEDDRTRLIDIENANAEPVLLMYRARAAIDRLVRQVCDGEAPACEVTAEDGSQHALWMVSDGDLVGQLVEEFAGSDTTYIADGHHRIAAASRVARLRRARDPRAVPQAAYEFFMAALFPHDQLRILPYHRVVRDLGPISLARFLERVSERFEVAPADTAAPRRPGTFGMLADGRWYRLTPRGGNVPGGDPVASLDVSVLQTDLLGPILGIRDPRTDPRLEFVGGHRGTAELERRCREDAVVAFALHPSTVEQLMTIADAGAIMPPKSTWFDPKLRSGLVLRMLTGD